VQSPQSDRFETVQLLQDAAGDVYVVLRALISATGGVTTASNMAFYKYAVVGIAGCVRFKRRRCATDADP